MWQDSLADTAPSLVPQARGKSNLVTVLMETISEGTLPNARAIVIDLHGEYGTALGAKARVFRTRPDEEAGERHLRVPFWALPFSELQQLTLGGLQPNHEAAIRDQVLDMKVAAAEHLTISSRHRKHSLRILQSRSASSSYGTSLINLNGSPSTLQETSRLTKRPTLQMKSETRAN